MRDASSWYDDGVNQEEHTVHNPASVPSLFSYGLSCRPCACELDDSDVVALECATPDVFLSEEAAERACREDLVLALGPDNDDAALVLASFDDPAEWVDVHWEYDSDRGHGYYAAVVREVVVRSE